MRLDKFFSSQNILSRKEVGIAVKQKRITVDGEIIKNKDFSIDEHKNTVCLDGNEIKYCEFVYIMMNKPKGVISATEDVGCKTVLDLLPSTFYKRGLFPVGRLDKDTVGLIILTDDGVSAHKLLSPKYHVEKTYLYNCAEPLLSEDKQQIENGMRLKDGTITKSSVIEQFTPTSGKITLTEGKYHEIKRLFGAVGNKITYLKRISFGKIILDDSLQEGEWRELTDDEKKFFTT